MKPAANRRYSITPTRYHAKLAGGIYFVTESDWSIAIGDMFKVKGNGDWLAVSFYDFREVTMTIERNKYHLVVPTDKEALIKEGIYKITWATAGEFMIEGSPVYHNPNLYEIKPVGEAEMARALNLMEKRLHEVERQNADLVVHNKRHTETIETIAEESHRTHLALNETRTRLQEQRATTVFYEAENRRLAGMVLVLTKQAIPELNDRIEMLQREVALMNQAGAARQREHLALQTAYAAAAVDLIGALKQKVFQLSIQNTYHEKLSGALAAENVQLKATWDEMRNQIGELVFALGQKNHEIRKLEGELVDSAEELAEMAEFVDQIQQLAQVLGLVGTVIEETEIVLDAEED